MVGEAPGRFMGAGILIVWIAGAVVGVVVVLVLWSAPDTRLIAFIAILVSWGIVLRIAVALYGLRADARLKSR